MQCVCCWKWCPDFYRGLNELLSRIQSCGGLVVVGDYVLSTKSCHWEEIPASPVHRVWGGDWAGWPGRAEESDQNLWCGGVVRSCALCKNILSLNSQTRCWWIAHGLWSHISSMLNLAPQWPNWAPFSSVRNWAGLWLWRICETWTRVELVTGWSAHLGLPEASPVLALDIPHPGNPPKSQIDWVTLIVTWFLPVFLHSAWIIKNVSWIKEWMQEWMHKVMEAVLHV